MGVTQSTSANKPVIKKYSDAEIKKNIMNLFNNNKSNNFSEASININDLDNIVISEDAIMQGGGGNMKFKSSKNRHLQHNINQYIKYLEQTGGNPNNDNAGYQDISEISEFDKIKEFLINEKNKQSQIGGDIDMDNDQQMNFSSPETISEKPKLTIFDVLRGGGKQNEDTSESQDIDVDMFGGADDEEDDLEDDLDEDNDIENNEDNEDSENINEDNDNNIEEKNETDEINSTSSDSDIPNKNEEFSESSFGNKSSELNIMPFYSSDTSENRHPYIKNRFNK